MRHIILALVASVAAVLITLRRILEHMGLPADPPERAPPRAVQRGLEF
jgi:hypothetical protein